MSKVVGYFADADMRQGYDGLRLVAKKQHIDLDNLPKGHFVAFTNRAMNKIKICTQNDLVTYLRMPRGRKIDPRVIQHIPEYFDGQEFSYDRAIRAVIREKFPRFFSRETSSENEARV